MENQEIPGRIQMERLIPVEIFQKKLLVFCKMVQLNPVPVFGAKKIPVPFFLPISVQMVSAHKIIVRT